MTARRLLVTGTVAALAAVAGASCDGSGRGGEVGAAAGEGALRVVASTSVVGDVVREVVGERGEVEVLMDRGTDPHAFQPSARQAAGLRDADLVVVHGLGLEPNLEGAVEGAARDGVAVFALSEAADPLPYEATTGAPHAEGDGDHGGDHGGDPGDGEHGEHGALDPHVWFDPVRMADSVRALGTALAEVDTSHDWAGAADAYARELVELHGDIEEMVATVPSDRRVLVTNHEVLGYFARRYGFAVLAAIVPGGTTLAEPSAADLAELVEILTQEQVPAIFTETSQPSRLADTLRGEVGGDVEVVSLHTESLGAPGSGADSYVGMMRENTRRIVEALAP